MSTDLPNNSFRARSRNSPRSRGPRPHDKARIAILSAQSSSARRTCLLGSIKSSTQSAPAHVRIVYLD